MYGIVKVPMKAHRIEIYIVDFENYGIDNYLTTLEQHRHLNARIGKTATVEIGDWDDDHPMNVLSTDVDEYFNNLCEEQQVGEWNIPTMYCTDVPQINDALRNDNED